MFFFRKKKKNVKVLDDKDLYNKTANIVYYNVFETPNNSSVVKVGSGKAVLKVFDTDAGKIPGIMVGDVFVPLKPEDTILRVDGTKEVNILKISPSKLRPLKAYIVGEEIYKDESALKNFSESLSRESLLFTPMSHDEQVIYTTTIKELDKRHQSFFEKYGVVIITGIVAIVGIAMIYLIFDRSAQAVTQAYNIGLNNGYKAFMNSTSELIKQTINYTQTLR